MPKVIIEDSENFLVGDRKYHIPLMKTHIDGLPFGWVAHEKARYFSLIRNAVEEVASGKKRLEDKTYYNTYEQNIINWIRFYEAMGQWR